MVVARSTTLSLAALIALGSMPAAQAADYSQPPPPPPPVYIQQPPPVQDIAEGWYLRGDIGFSNQEVGSLFNEQYNAFKSVKNIDKGFDAAPFFGIGIGYNFNDWLRLDVTGEYRGRANFHGLDIGALPGGGYATDRYTASKSEWTFLLNGYVDLGTWHSITPFVGAGIGMSRNTIINFGDFATCINSSSCAGSGGSDAYAGTVSKWNMAWALHAGLAYKVSKNFTVELAYRYLNLGNAVTGPTVAFDGSQSFPPFEFRHLTSHDVKLGLRFNLDGFADYARPPAYYSQPQVYMPPPVYAPPVYAPPPLHSKG